jgi:coproporphyrinogen III oxidase
MSLPFSTLPCVSPPLPPHGIRLHQFANTVSRPPRSKLSRRRIRGAKSTILVAAAAAASANPSSTSSTPPSSFASSSAQVDSFADALFDIQDELLRAVEELDGSGARFLREPWTRTKGAQGVSAPGRGLTAVLQGGALIEKGAASVTHVSGALSAARASALASRGVPGAVEGAPYAAAALSIVFHSRSPHVPTLRGDVRVFSTGDPSSGSSTSTSSGSSSSSSSGSSSSSSTSSSSSSLASFGGGADLTPFVLYEEDVEAFHGYWKRVCDEAEEEAEAARSRRRTSSFSGSASSPASSSNSSSPSSPLYRALKSSCDEYFYIPARKEHRGTGGIFFDGALSKSAENENENEAENESENKTPSSSPLLQIDGRAFAERVARGWLPSWLPAVQARRHLPVSDRQRQWQLLRRGRYVEFNLLYDRGVRFGLDGGGDVDAVMVSAPPLVAWEHRAGAQSADEDRLMGVLREPRDWA